MLIIALFEIIVTYIFHMLQVQNKIAAEILGNISI